MEPPRDRELPRLFDDKALPEKLIAAAGAERGFFRRNDALVVGLDDSMLHYWVRRGAIKRMGGGRYKLLDPPYTAKEERILRSLLPVAKRQIGCFNVGQAIEAGFARSSLYRWVDAGRFERKARGVYQFPHLTGEGDAEQVMVAWLAYNDDAAVISHRTVLMLRDLVEAYGPPFHFTLPRSKRSRTSKMIDGMEVVIHTTQTLRKTRDVRKTRDGFTVTSVERAIADVLGARQLDLQLDQLQTAVVNAYERGYLDIDELRRQCEHLPAAKRNLVEMWIAAAEA